MRPKGSHLEVLPLKAGFQMQPTEKPQVSDVGSVRRDEVWGSSEAHAPLLRLSPSVQPALLGSPEAGLLEQLALL